jgi:hypothetical protein
MCRTPFSSNRRNAPSEISERADDPAYLDFNSEISIAKVDTRSAKSGDSSAEIEGGPKDLSRRTSCLRDSERHAPDQIGMENRGQQPYRRDPQEHAVIQRRDFLKKSSADEFCV